MNGWMDGRMVRSENYRRWGINRGIHSCVCCLILKVEDIKIDLQQMFAYILYADCHLSGT